MKDPITAWELCEVLQQVPDMIDVYARYTWSKKRGSGLIITGLIAGKTVPDGWELGVNHSEQPGLRIQYFIPYKG